MSGVVTLPVTVQFHSISWVLGCLTLAAFPMMPVVGREANVPVV